MKQLIEQLKKRGLWQITAYLFVGGCATLVEWAGFWLLSNLLGVQYLWATAAAFLISTFANWLLGRALVFRDREGLSLVRELVSVYAASIAGLLFNLLIMYALVQGQGTDKMVSKVIATVIVFAYNYLIRKLVIYRKK